MEIIFFETDMFNLTKEGEHFINPGCFGEDFANWLKLRLEKNNILVTDIYQEDWGWELACMDGEQGYYLGVGGLSEEGSDLGEWRVMFTKRRKIFDSLLGRNKLSKSDRTIEVVKSILEEANFPKLRFEENV